MVKERTPLHIVHKTTIIKHYSVSVATEILCFTKDQHTQFSSIALHLWTYMSCQKCCWPLQRHGQKQHEPRDAKEIHLYILLCYKWLCWTGYCLYIIVFASDAIHCCNESRQFPLQVACRGNTIPEVILLLLKLYPRATQKMDDYDKCLSITFQDERFHCQMKHKKWYPLPFVTNVLK